MPTDPFRCLTYFGYRRLTDDERASRHFPRLDDDLVKCWMYTKLEDGKITNEKCRPKGSSPSPSPSTSSAEARKKRKRTGDDDEDGLGQPAPKRRKLTYVFTYLS